MSEELEPAAKTGMWKNPETGNDYMPRVTPTHYGRKRLENGDRLFAAEDIIQDLYDRRDELKTEIERARHKYPCEVDGLIARKKEIEKQIEKFESSQEVED